MQLQLPFSPLILSVILLGVYAFSAYWLLKRENWKTLTTLTILTLGAAWLHTYQIWEFPPGINDDEIKTLKSTHEYFTNRKIFVLAAQGPILHAVLFQMPLVWWTDSVMWAMRTYPIVFGVLAVPMSFCVGRSLLFGTIPSLVTATLVAVLPWSLFWGRISWGGEIFFYQALLLAALGRIIWCQGGKVEMVIGAIGLSGLIWEYTGAWSMLAMPFIGALVSLTWRQRALCLGIFALAIALWIPYLLNINEWWQYISTKVSVTQGKPATSLSLALPEIANHVTLALQRTLRAFRHPEGNVYWISMHSVAIHPEIVLVVAGLGTFACLARRSIFITLGFLAGLTPALLSFNGAASTHRMICAFIFISIACGGFFNLASRLLKGKIGKALVSATAFSFVVIAGKDSVNLFFSSTFWSQSDRIFFQSETLLSESIRLPLSSPLTAGPQVGRLLDARGVANSGVRNLAYDSLLPTQPTTVTLSPALQTLIPFYTQALPAERITSFGSGQYGTSIKAEFTSSEVERWKKYGWTAERRCADRVLKGIRIPMFFITNALGWSEPCPGQSEVIFKAKWVREPKELSILTFGGASVKVETSGGTSIPSSTDIRAVKKFMLHPGETVTLTVTKFDGTLAWLAEGPDNDAALPPLESFQPIP